MGSTPEGKVKTEVRELLALHSQGMYYNMPVPSGYGEPMLDFVGCYYGRFFMIETKAAVNLPLTPRQDLTKEQVEEARGQVFIISGPRKDTRSWEGWEKLGAWLREVQQGHEL